MPSYKYQPHTTEVFEKLPINVVSRQSHKLGMDNCEPLIVILDSLIRYASAYRERFEQPLSDDGVLGPAWLQSVCGTRDLLNGDGAVAMFHDRTTDCKDNGCCESMFWHAMELAGFTESDIV